jgi:hypothetical protein
MTQRTPVAVEKAAPETVPFGRRAKPVLTTQERLAGIEQMRQRVNGYVEFMCRVDDLKGTSDESKENAVIAFFERMAILEQQLGRISEELRLG